MSRIDTQAAISPAVAKLQRYDAQRTRLLNKEGGKAQKRISQTVIGIVSNKSVSRSRNIIIELEDNEDSIICIIPAGREGYRIFLHSLRVHILLCF